MITLNDSGTATRGFASYKIQRGENGAVSNGVALNVADLVDESPTIANYATWTFVLLESPLCASG